MLTSTYAQYQVFWAAGCQHRRGTPNHKTLPTPAGPLPPTHPLALFVSLLSWASFFGFLCASWHHIHSTSQARSPFLLLSPALSSFSKLVWRSPSPARVLSSTSWTSSLHTKSTPSRAETSVTIAHRVISLSPPRFARFRNRCSPSKPTLAYRVPTAELRGRIGHGRVRVLAVLIQTERMRSMSLLTSERLLITSRR